MRGVLHRQGFQANKTAQPVIGMDHQIAGRQGTGLDNDIGGFAPPSGPRQPIAENVLFGEDGDGLGLEPALDRQDCAQHGFRRRLGDLVPMFDGNDLADAMIIEDRGQAIGCARTP